MEFLKRIRKEPPFNREQFFYEKSHYLHHGISFIEILSLSDSLVERKLSEEIQNGVSLSEAMKGLGLFLDKEIHMISLAEETGDLSGVFSRISTALLEERKLKEKILGILIYPLLLLAATAVFFLGALYFILPSLYEMLQGLDVHHGVLFFFYTMQQTIPLPILAGIFILGGYNLLVLLKKKRYLNRWIFGRKLYEYEEMKFVDALYLLLKAGIDLMEAFHLLAEEGYSCTGIAEGIREGVSLSESFQNVGSTSLLVRYLKVSEETGNMEESLFAYLLLRKAYFEEYMKRRTALLEPISVFVLGCILFLMSLLLLMPMLDAYENL